MRILLVEDDEILAQILTEHLTTQHYAVDVATDGVAGFSYAQAVSYDLIVLDVNLPQLNGIQLCQLLRQNRYTVPILLLTAKGDSSDKVLGLDAGADDYVVKPCTIDEISARIRALLRRPSLVASPILTWGSLHLNPVTCEVTSNGQLLSLSPKEYSLLELFLRNPQRTFSSGTILEHLWSFEDAPGEETIRSHIKRLRRKIKDSGNGEIIETVYGMGYRLKPPPAQSTAAAISPSDSATPPVSPPASTEDAARTAAIAMWEQFKQPIMERVIVLDQAVAGLATGDLPESLRQSAANAAHKLAGSLAMFGFPAGSQVGRELEKALQNPLEPSDANRLKALVTELHHILQQPVNVQEALLLHDQPIPPAQQPLLQMLLVCDDPLFTQPLQAVATHQGVQINITSNLSDVQVQLVERTPDVILLDLTLTGEDDVIFLKNLTNQFSKVPLMGLTDRSDFVSRLAGVRMGCDRVVSKTTPPHEVFMIVRNLLFQRSTQPIKVLAVDDDPLVLGRLDEWLPRWDIDLTTLTSPDHLWQTLEITQPDLVILNVEMPTVNGIELCQLIRSDRVWNNLPVLFLTAHREPDMVARIYQAGADDYVSKPFTEPEIITRIFNRLARNRLLIKLDK